MRMGPKRGGRDVRTLKKVPPLSLWSVDYSQSGDHNEGDVDGANCTPLWTRVGGGSGAGRSGSRTY